MYPYHVAELARVTDEKNGWIALSVSDHFEPQVSELAKAHGGQVWKMDRAEGQYALRILPPASLAGRDDLKARFAAASAHDLFDIVLHSRAGA
ncbi:MAG: hypothetical protein V4754_09340 [Pseudomonadota bacterium]